MALAMKISHFGGQVDPTRDALPSLRGASRLTTMSIGGTCMNSRWLSLFILLFPAVSQAQTSADHLKSGLQALQKKDVDAALDHADKAIKADAKNTPAYLFRAALFELKDRYADSVADYTKALALDPTEADALHARGCVQFKQGKFDASLADFDKFIALRPDRAIKHWQRGITCFYAGKFDEGKRQFEAYQEFDSADIENALWRFMCMARKEGLVKARDAMLKIGDDKRVPMRAIYEMYVGRKTPADVLTTAIAGDLKPADRNRQLFYAYLYVGIWFDLIGDRGKAIEHLDRAADDHRIGHYMWDVARVHRDWLKAKK